MSDAPMIRAARLEDAEPLSAFAARAFHDTFAAENTAADMAAYLAEHFTPARQRGELSDPGMRVLLAERAGSVVGYVQLRPGAAPATSPLEAPVELKRIYVGRESLGRGVGGPLMRRALDAARRAGGCSIWLAVWERNARAIAFYRKWGFEVVGEQTFVLGSDVQNDLVMARPLDDADLLEPQDAAASPDHRSRTEEVR